MHNSTHADSPAHVIPESPFTHELPIQNYFGEAVCLDIPKGKWELITIEEIDEATYFEGESLRTVEQLPAGAWGVGYRPMTNAPYFYKIGDYKTSHGKIYGDAGHYWIHYGLS